MPILFSVSCSDRLEEQIPDGTMVGVQFSLDIEGSINTRAISDGTTADQLMWAIFSEQGELIIPKTVKENVTGLTSDTGCTFSVSLAKGKTYRAAFWAQSSQCQAYSVSDDMKVTINYEGVNNDETRDAFFASSEPFVVDESTMVSLVLKRPFAQVNVGAFPWDLEYAVDSGLNPELSAAVIKAVPNCVNLLDGSVEGEVDVNYTFAPVPEEELLVDVDENGEKETYEYLSMSYILASPESSVCEMQFTFSDVDGNSSFTFQDGLGFVPVQRNWRTNIVGQILTGDMSFNIKIDPVYDGEQINSGGLYYNFFEDTVIENKVFAFNTYADAIFTSENNNLIEMNNVEFSGRVQYIAIGEYRDRGNYVEFTNKLDNIVAKDIVVTHSKGIANVQTIDYMAPLFFFRGVTTITNSTFTGTTCISEDKVDYNGTVHKVLPYDCGVPNFCNTTFDNCTISNLYAWSHSQITLKNTKVDYIRCSTHKKSYKVSHLTVDAGSEVGEIFVTSSGVQKFVTIDGVKTLTADPWSPCLIVKAGAKVGVIDYNGRPIEDVIIEEGAQVGEVKNVGE